MSCGLVVFHVGEGFSVECINRCKQGKQICKCRPVSGMSYTTHLLVCGDDVAPLDDLQHPQTVVGKHLHDLIFFDPIGQIAQPHFAACHLDQNAAAGRQDSAYATCV